MFLKRIILSKSKKMINQILSYFDHECVHKKDLIDFYLHDYSDYKQYKDIQEFHNIRKINKIWADKITLDRVAKILRKEFSKPLIKGLCHGTRNGFEQNYLNSLPIKINAIGTDISKTAKNYKNTVQWDFHDENEDWKNKFDFIYTNSLDQSWKPKKALITWFRQINKNGLLIIEHTNLHGPKGASEMDPFGVKPTVMPYVLTKWFGSQISISHSVDKKENNNLDAWLFVLKKNVTEVKTLDI